METRAAVALASGKPLTIETVTLAGPKAGQPLELRRHPGYDHSYWFIQTFIADHLEHHARGLAG